MVFGKLICYFIKSLFFKKLIIVSAIIISVMLINESCYDSGTEFFPIINTDKDTMHAKTMNLGICLEHLDRVEEYLWNKEIISKENKIVGNMKCEILTYREEWIVHGIYHTPLGTDPNCNYIETRKIIRTYYKDPYTEQGNCCDLRPCTLNTCIKCSNGNCAN